MKRIIVFVVAQVLTLQAAILPPPWADPERNPCATQPGGWLLVYWPPDGKCYRIFQRGPPCPETMELNPVQDHLNRTIAECRCPPRTALDTSTNVCYPINTVGPCESGEYFAPMKQLTGGPLRQRMGRCIRAKLCKPEEVFWAANGECFLANTKGPCSEGQLIVLNEETQLGECQCSKSEAFSKFYWEPTKTCHEYFTKGPCLEKGTLFLPGPTCGCYDFLPNYDPVTKKCYQIGGKGPCKGGQKFVLVPPHLRASCECKPEHVPWDDGQCYRLYTRGPCRPGEILFANKTCSENPCPKGKLYFPEDGMCHRVGVRGPCPRSQLVLFEQSVEGISYRGICGCSGPEKCKEEEEEEELDSAQIGGRSNLNEIEGGKSNLLKSTRSSHQYFKENAYKIRVCRKNENPLESNCHALYSQGPCSQGEWLVPARQGRTERSYHRFGWSEPEPDSDLLYDESTKLRTRCECKPGFSKSSTGKGCHLPLINLAKFLNGKDLFS